MINLNCMLEPDLTHNLSVPGRSLLSISDTPKASFIEIIVDYIVEKLDNTMDIYTSTSETVFINNDTLFLTWSFQTIYRDWYFVVL